MKERLRKIEKDLKDRFGDADSEAKDRAAFDALVELQRELRREMLDQQRLTMWDGQTQDPDVG